jgi:hypothetical protein
MSCHAYPGVLCVEELDLSLAPLALAVEQQHAVCLVEFAHSAAEPFSGSQPGAALYPLLPVLLRRRSWCSCCITRESLAYCFRCSWWP